VVVDANDNVYAGGTFLDPDGAPFSGVAKWDGMAWPWPCPGAPCPAMHLVLDGGGNVYAGGDFTIHDVRGRLVRTLVVAEIPARRPRRRLERIRRAWRGGNVDCGAGPTRCCCTHVEPRVHA
jgi:hypothetical protein